MKLEMIENFVKEDVQVRHYAPNIKGLILGQCPNAATILKEGTDILETVGARHWFVDKDILPEASGLNIEAYVRWGTNTRELEVSIQVALHDAGFILKRTKRYKRKLQQLAYIKDNVMFIIHFMNDGIDGKDLIGFGEEGIRRLSKTLIPKE